MPSPRGRDRRTVRDRFQILKSAAYGRQPDALQIRGQKHGGRGRKDRDVYAEAGLRRQRFGNALPPKLMEGRRSAFWRGSIRRTVGNGEILHRPALVTHSRAPPVFPSPREILP